MSRKKKYVLAAVPVCIIAFSFAACGADTEEATVKAATAAASETSTAMTMTEKDTNAKIQALEKYKLAAENKDAEEETPYQRYWNGDWYGWGGFTNGTSLYAETDGIFFDCMARVSIDAGGEAFDFVLEILDFEGEFATQGFDAVNLRKRRLQLIEVLEFLLDRHVGGVNLFCHSVVY